MRKILIALFILAIVQSCTSPADNRVSESSKKDSTATSSSDKHKKVIVFFGNSITAGYGLESKDAFTTLIQARLDSISDGYEVINAGVSGETTTTGSNRVSWVVERQPVDIFVLELGANDGLRGVPVSETKTNLETIIDLVRKAHPDAEIILAGMMVPPSMGPEYSTAFKNVFPEVAKNKNVTLIPFVLNNVAGIDSLNQADGIHPNVEGEKIVMENVWTVLKDFI